MLLAFYWKLYNILCESSERVSKLANDCCLHIVLSCYKNKQVQYFDSPSRIHICIYKILAQWLFLFLGILKMLSFTQYVICSRYFFRAFSVSYQANVKDGKAIYLAMVSDWDVDAAFLSSSDPFLRLKVEIKPFEQGELLHDKLGTVALILATMTSCTNDVN